MPDLGGLLLIPGVTEPTGRQMMVFNEPINSDGTNIPATLENARRFAARYKIMCLTAGDEAWAIVLSGLVRIPQYILGFEVELSSLSPYHNGWSLGSSLAVRCAIFKHQMWWHTGKATVTAAAAAGSTSVQINNFAGLQSIHGGFGLIDHFSSTGVKKGTFSYGAFKTDTGANVSTNSATISTSLVTAADAGRPCYIVVGSKTYTGFVGTTANITAGTYFVFSSTQGTQTNKNITTGGTATVYFGYLSTDTVINKIPATGFMSMGYAPGTFTDLVGASYSPGVQSGSGVAVGDILWGRATSNAVKLNGGGFFPEPRSQEYQTWCQQSFAYYRATTTGGNKFTEILLDNCDVMDSRFPVANNPIRPGGSINSATGFFTATDWTTAQSAISTTEFQDSYANCLKAYAKASPNGKLWGNTTWGTSTYSAQTGTANYIAALNKFADNGLTGAMIENGGGFCGEYSSPYWESQAKIANIMSVYDTMNARGVEILGVTQGEGSTVGAVFAEDRDDPVFAMHMIMWNELNYYMAPTSSDITNGYHLADQPRTAPYLGHYGRPTGPRTSTGTAPLVWHRTFDKLQVDCAIPSGSGSACTATFTPR